MNKLFSSFNQSNHSDWQNTIIKELKGLDYNETLVYETLEGIKINPFYTTEVSEVKNFTLNKTQKGWDVFTEITNQDLLNLNEVDGLVIDLEQNKPNKNFKNILLSKNPYLFNNYLNEPENAFFKLDIYGGLFKSGNWFKDQESDETLIKNVLNTSNSKKVICVDNSIFQNAGANIVQQIAIALCHANEYIEKFGNDAINRIYFNFSVGGNFFFEIAKLRAFRFLWDSFVASKNINSEAYLFTENSFRNKSKLDKDNNTIRNSIECCAAILGGSNGILINSHEIISLNKNEFSFELAHKIQLILKQESFFNEFLDPIAGNYYVESITDELIEKSSALFREIEKSGGLIIGMKTGSIQKMVEDSNQKEFDLFNNNKNILIGVNKYKLEKLDYINEEAEKTFINTQLFNPISPTRLALKIEKTNE
ncbi:MAG: methylmalonyl-CoA mutase family protein [Solirubrobacteraceae bacterium]